MKFNITNLRYINTVDKAHKTVVDINKVIISNPDNVMVFSTIADPNISKIITSINTYSQDLLQTFIEPLEEHLKVKASHISGLSYALRHTAHDRIEAIHFAINNDDGISTSNYDSADIILVGVSRTGKTPTCLYLAMHYGIRAANFPILPEDLSNHITPKCILEHHSKIFGLSIDVARLQKIRQERIPFSNYAKKEQCQLEVERVESLFKKEHIPYLNSTHLSIEELATKILATKKLQ